MSQQPKIDDAPGITWRPNKWGWEARWRARADLVKRGFRPKVVRLWASTEKEREPNAARAAFIADRCNAMQSEMLVWGRGGLPQAPVAFDATVIGLIRSYQTDRYSGYKDKRYATRQYYDNLCRQIERDVGEDRLPDDLKLLDARAFHDWHAHYLDAGKIGMGHSLVGMIRTLVSYGRKFQKSAECREIKEVLHEMRFRMPKSRDERLTADMAIAIRKEAQRQGWKS